jgi:glycosyltransferase involved in cell wall biosynthesis
VAVLEAMALGRPVVATRVGGLPGVIHNGRHGFLVEPGDPRALAEPTLRLLRDSSLRQAMGEASVARVQESFSVQHMVRSIEQVYSELLEGRPGAKSSGVRDVPRT